MQVPAELNKEQAILFEKIINANDYFLLWGPPGTGKTSIMLKNLVRYLMEETDEEIMLLAYTNRAVDEICQAIEDIGPNYKNKYLRIGSRFSTNEKFKNQLLATKMESIQKRKDLLDLLKSRRIFVSTVSSTSGNRDIFKIKQFHRVIIDEASQILEPMLVGLLPLFNQAILIGDHKQLPAVVTQEKEESNISSDELKKAGFNNLRDSLFERIMRQCKANKWTWAYGNLAEQGRMHEDIMAFPGEYFYEKKLKVIQKPEALNRKLTSPLHYSFPENATRLEKDLSTKRMIYIPTKTNRSIGQDKTNSYEAAKVIEIIEAYKRLLLYSGIEFKDKSIGVITPYRAQIARIREEMNKARLDYNEIGIDTVERYQGGARDIIILSLCTNRIQQLNALISLSDEGIDRKLNVALTRAREQLIILGNQEILSSNETYKQLIKFCNK